MIFKIFIHALKITLKQKKMISLLWAVAFLFSLPAFWVVQKSLNSYFTGRQVASEWLNGFDLNYLFEMINDFPTITQSINGLVGGSLLLFLVVSIFLTGGVIGRLYKIVAGEAAADSEFAGPFFQFSGKFFFRFFRVFLWTLLLSVVSFAFMMIGTYAGIITALLIALWVITSDITKIRLLSGDSTKVTKVYFSSLVWVLKNVLPLSGIYFLNFVILALGFFLYKTLDNAFTPDAGYKIFLMFLSQQVFVFFRTVIRVQIFGSAICLWNEKSAGFEKTEQVLPPISSSEQTQPA